MELLPYKDRPGTFESVTRRNMFKPENSNYEVRYFEVGPEGYTSFEKHEHEHCVVVLRGEGKVRLGDEWSDVSLNDTVYVGPMVPHQFRNTGVEPFGILCVVDKDRDRPIVLDSEGNPRTSD
jgi:mannose-6-phosphate isomerase-like protein (cupin superfamily)